MKKLSSKPVVQRHFENSDLLCKSIREQFDDVLLSFSMGKDSLASYYQLLKYWKPENIYPVWLYKVPGLQFQLDSLKKYEDRLFHKHIMRLPDPWLYNQLSHFLFQPPQNVAHITDLFGGTFKQTYEQLFDSVKIDLGLPQLTPVAVGNRADDNLRRRQALLQHGSYTATKQKFYPIYDFSQADIIESLTVNKAFLPIDYKIWGRSFDGLMYRFLEPMRRHLPEDYARIKQYFPLIDIEFLRYGDFTYGNGDPR